MLSLDNSVGLKVKITTTSDAVITGVIHSYNPQTGLLSIIKNSPTSSSQSPSNKSNFIIIKSNFIKQINSLTKQKPTNTAKTNMTEKFQNQSYTPQYIPTSLIGQNYKNENAKLIAKHENAFKLRKSLNGRKITNEGKEIFKSLFNLLPSGDVTFDSRDNIVVFDSHLLVAKPYGVDNCKVARGSGEDDNQQLAYIKKIVKDVWNRLESERKGG
ncbi:hypothetical protein CANARDRAFT_28778 [[Candida] arabinofermentans NRRL YB-2248]|uniref:AD domain-containing protein n=1 Tax=[Candida] arabinofermentans NRRL YB-2248 TaxID=983967 RepID=A0A1E4SZY6_9ASCO|nr:hypothetical protein CANARDRAFT_28778 [[Candida] arabinofermentans NRRL YB-2248]